VRTKAEGQLKNMIKGTQKIRAHRKPGRGLGRRARPKTRARPRPERRPKTMRELKYISLYKRAGQLP
jgi:hypothetical protein